MSSLDNYDSPKPGETWLIQVDGAQGRTEIVEVVKQLPNSSYLVLRTVVASLSSTVFIKEVD